MFLLFWFGKRVAVYKTYDPDINPKEEASSREETAPFLSYWETGLLWFSEVMERDLKA